MENGKVWEIDDSMKKAKVMKTKVDGPRPKGRAKLIREEKNPALAFSLSLLLWGGGQLYNQQWKAGLIRMGLMLFFYLFFTLTILFWDVITTVMMAIEVRVPQILTACGILYLVGMLFWLSGAVRAYGDAGRPRKKAFNGIGSALLPPLCSLLIPGWGQFLNGQAKKGTLFLLIAAAGFFAFPVILITPLLWPTFETGLDRLFWERHLAAALILSPPVLLIWIISPFDAIRVSLDEVKKEPIRKRIGYTLNRIGMHGWVRGLLPQVKVTVMLALCLLLSVVISYSYFPRQFYARGLQDLQVELSEQEMVLIPRLTGKILHSAFPDSQNTPRPGVTL